MRRLLDRLRAAARVSAAALMGGRVSEAALAHGVFIAECYGPDGELKWRDEFHNTVVTVGKNLILDQALAGSAYTAGEFLGLISSASYSAISAADTMASHAGWVEAGGTNAPAYTGSRPTAVFAAASAGAISLATGLVYTFTSSGTVQGAFLTYGSGAVTTKDSTGGVLWSAGAFATPQPVIATNVLTVSYSASM